jgi:ATP-dependent Lon protease
MITFSDGALDRVILEYTREAGVRNLEREIGNICRKVAKNIALGSEGLTRINSGNVQKYLGAPKFLSSDTAEPPRPGVAVGLAWTPVGGETMEIEVSAVKGKGTLTLTGSLGEVMKESAQAALTYIRSRSARLGISAPQVAGMDVHVHVPAGATPKDGPSAGIAITTAIISALLEKAPRKEVAMTGEITLTGRVLPIGGLRDKMLAAKRAGMKRVVIPERNMPELAEMPAYVTRGMQVMPVSTMDEALKEVFPPRSFKAAGKAGGKAAGKTGVKKKASRRAPAKGRSVK